MEPDGNTLSSYELVCNEIYTSTGRHKSSFYVDPFKRQKTVTVSIRKVSIPNIDIKVWTRKSELLLGNYLHYLTQPESTRQKPIELTGIEYDQIKDEFSSVPH